MKRPTERLLADLLEETAPADFRAALLQETLRHARRRKRVRRLGYAVVAAVIAAFIAGNFHKPGAPLVVINPPGVSGLTIVQSQPLRPEQIVNTGAGSIREVPSSAGSVAMVDTSVSDRFYIEIVDRQLLALLGGKPAALVKQGPDASELIFVNPADRREFLVP